MIFQEYSAAGEFTGNKWDLMAMRYVYMDSLRKHVVIFVRDHNNHPIRRQRKRSDYLLTGRPVTNYKIPKAPIINHGRKADPKLLAELQAEVQDWDPDEYLHPEVIEVCKSILRKHDLPLQPKDVLKDSDGHRIMYRTLRKELWEYENDGGKLPARVLPRGGKAWIWQNHELQKSKDKIHTELAKEMEEDNDIDEEIFDPWDTAEHEFDDECKYTKPLRALTMSTYNKIAAADFVPLNLST